MKHACRFVGMFFRLVSFSVLFLIAFALLVATCHTWGVSPPSVETLTPFAVVGYLSLEVIWLSEGP